MLPGDELQEALWANAGPAGKEALEVILTQTNLCRQTRSSLAVEGH